MNLRIEMFGTLIEELNYWHNSCEQEDSMFHEDDDSLQYCEDRFIETLKAVRDMRKALLDDFEVYFNDCKVNSVPPDIGYYRVKKQLQESTFELVRGN